MNICFCGHFTAGGTEKATFMVANYLINYDKVFIISAHQNSPFFYLDDRVQYDHFHADGIASRIFEFYRYIKNHKIDVVISVEAMTGIYSVTACKLAGCKHIIWEHANYYQSQGSKYINIVRRIELAFAEQYIVLTKRDLQNFTNHYKFHCPINYIYNVVEERKSIEYDVESKEIISVGIVREIKNFKVIPEIAEKLFEKHPEWVWKIYGVAKGAYADELRAMIYKRNLSNKVFICGQQKNMDSIYKNAAICVMTSTMEGLPMSLLEARAYGLPLVSFDIETGPDEIIDDGVNGYLIEYGNIDQMIKQINCLIEQENLRESMSKHAAVGLQKFSISEIGPQWKEVICRVVNGEKKI